MVSGENEMRTFEWIGRVICKDCGVDHSIREVSLDGISFFLCLDCALETEERISKEDIES